LIDFAEKNIGLVLGAEANEEAGKELGKAQQDEPGHLIIYWGWMEK